MKVCKEQVTNIRRTKVEIIIIIVSHHSSREHRALTKFTKVEICTSNFHSYTVHIDTITVFYLPTDAQ
jgi:hypothetical protein